MRKVEKRNAETTGESAKETGRETSWFGWATYKDGIRIDTATFSGLDPLCLIINETNWVIVGRRVRNEAILASADRCIILRCEAVEPTKIQPRISEVGKGFGLNRSRESVSERVGCLEKDGGITGTITKCITRRIKIRIAAWNGNLNLWFH